VLWVFVARPVFGQQSLDIDLWQCFALNLFLGFVFLHLGQPRSDKRQNHDCKKKHASRQGRASNKPFVSHL
jgi:hypothetical protein